MALDEDLWVSTISCSPQSKNKHGIYVSINEILIFLVIVVIKNHLQRKLLYTALDVHEH